MATAVLTIAGNIIAPGIGGAIGGLIGAYIDNEFIFKEDKDESPLENLQLQSSAEGGPAISLIGQQCRVRGQIIFMSPTFFRSTEVAVDLAVAIANDGAPIAGILRVYAEGYELFNETGASTTGPRDDLTISHVALSTGGKYLGGGSRIQSPIDGFDLTKFRAGIMDSVSMSGWDDGGNNWGNEVSGAGLNKGLIFYLYRRPDGTTGIYGKRRNPSAPPIVSVNESASPTKLVTLSQTFEPVNDLFISSIEILGGFPGQAVADDGTIKKHVGDTPAMELTVWFGLRGFRLAQFGNRVPEVVAIARESSSPVTIAQAIGKIFVGANWVKGTSLSWNTDALDAKIVKGYTMYEEGSIHNRLQPLMFAYDLATQIRGGEIYFFHPKDARIWAVPEEDWGASVGEPDVGLKFESLTPASLPSKVTVHYVDELTSWEDAAVERHIASPNIKSEDSLEIDLRGLVMDYAEAVEIAQRLLWRPHREGRKFNGKLPPRYWYILENDIIETSFNGRSIQLAIQKSDRGQDRMIELRGHVYEPDPRRSIGF